MKSKLQTLVYECIQKKKAIRQPDIVQYVLKIGKNSGKYNNISVVRSTVSRTLGTLERDDLIKKKQLPNESVGGIMTNLWSVK